jgi:3-oxoacyl-[acyl-carrier-protein] synthase-3
LVLNKLDARRSLERNEYILIATSNRISRITDYGCQQSGALFGDLATVTLITRCDSSKYGVRFELIDACYRKQPATKPFFDFASRTEVLSPTRSGQRYLDSSRVVFTLDGMGIADTAPRAMASAAAAILDKNKLAPEDIQFVVPHQAGASIVRFTQMKLEELGVSAQVINGLTADIGNVSSSSLPFALKKSWASLRGNILCPVAAVGAPGKSEVSHGCVFLRSLRHLDSKAA